MLKNGSAPFGNLKNDGCSCCNSKSDRRKAKHSAKRKETRTWKSQEAKDN